MKIKNSYIKLLLIMLMGALVGAAASIILVFYDRSSSTQYIFQTLYSNILSNTVWIQIILSAICSCMSVKYYLDAKKLYMSLDEEDETKIKVVKDKESNSLILSNLNIVLNLILFGVGIGHYPRYGFAFITCAVLIAVSVQTSITQCKVVQLIKRDNPMKKGDPMDFSFEKEWLNTCDEAEKLQIYKSAYKTYILQKYVLMVCIIIALLAKMFFQTGNFPIVLTGVLLGINIIAYCVYSKKYKN